MPRTWFPKPYAHAVARLRVLFGFALAAAFAWFSAPTARSLVWGLPVAAAGLALRAWAAGHLAKNQRLATSGPYGYLRNPLYLGTALVAAGLAIASRQALLAALFAAFFVLVYLPAIQLEEEYLGKLFPEHAAYAERVRMLWPSLSVRVAALLEERGIPGAGGLSGGGGAAGLEGVAVGRKTLGPRTNRNEHE
jgi:protein-S-isoprenylcysteine O-methyltransferase Ste14